jgi:hypothetical protein
MSGPALFERIHRQPGDGAATVLFHAGAVRQASPLAGRLGPDNGKKVNGQFEFNRDKTVYVNHYYFYIDDEDFGPLFLKICSSWGHELLRHNASEIDGLRQHVRPILFRPT